jgi:hypothetical protein
MRSLLLSLAVAALLPATALANHTQPPVDRGVLKGLYQPEAGFYKPGDAVPALATDAPKPDANGIYNPSGIFSSYDTNLYETLTFPMRQANDTSNADPLTSGDPRHGWCPPDPGNPGFYSGRCPNHQLEYLDHYERTMKFILKDFGVQVRRYDFNTGEDQPPVGAPGGVTTRQGTAHNIAAIVPGADHPEQMVVMGAHYDQTDGGPASTWDSQSGHASMVRQAAIMAEYWRKTGTRPSATMVWMSWDAEEAGTLGSQDWLAKNIASESAPKRVRAYFNDDPCAAAFPAFYHGNPAVHVPLVLQLADPSDKEDKARFETFNTSVQKVIDEFWADIDDTVQTAAGPMPVYTDADRDQIVPAIGGLLLFGSDFSNFEAAGVPIYNMFDDILGPHADGNPGFSSEGISILHTVRDNIPTWNAFTDADQTGLTASDGWMTGLEFCASLYSRQMLQPTMAGAQAASPDPLAYFDALPNDAPKGKLVTFDAGGTYQYASLPTRTYVNDADLQYKWDFGDKSPEQFGKVVKHAYSRIGLFDAKLTVTNRDTGASDTMTLQIKVVAEGAGNDANPPANPDPGLRAKNSLVACQSSQLAGAKVTPSGKGLAFDTGGRNVVVDVFEAGGKKNKRIARFPINGKGAWNGKKAKAKRTYFAQVVFRGTNARTDTLSFAFERTAKKFKKRKAFQKADTCDAVPVYRLSTPRFSGKAKLGIAFTLAQAGKAKVEVFKGKKRVKRFTKSAKPNRLVKLSLSPKKLKKGEYKVVLIVGGKKYTLYARRA